jgi:hypothetical protein
MRRLVPVSPQTRVTMAYSNRGDLRVELVAEYWLIGVRFAYWQFSIGLNRQRCD